MSHLLPPLPPQPPPPLPPALPPAPRVKAERQDEHEINELAAKIMEQNRHKVAQGVSALNQGLPNQMQMHR